MIHWFFDWLLHITPRMTTTSEQMTAMGYTKEAAHHLADTGDLVLKPTCWKCHKPKEECKYT